MKKTHTISKLIFLILAFFAGYVFVADIQPEVKVHEETVNAAS